MDENANVKYPTLEDLTGAAQALTRLQETYRLQVTDLAEGRLNGIIYSDDGRSAFETHTIPVSTISADDCFILGKALYEEGENAQALPWMMEAYQRIQKENHKTFTEVEVLDYISYIHYLLGDKRKALEWINKLLALEPTHAKGLGNAQNYQQTVDEEDRKMKEQEDAKNTPLNEATETVEEDTESYEYKKKVYEALCRGEIDVPREVARTLQCRYLTENHPFLRLAPIKMEYAFHNPDIIVFHGVMSDNEIEEIQTMAKPKFKRATVISQTGELIPAEYRISKSGWLANDEAPVIARVSRRIQDFTGLSLDTAEQLQVVNYGIGGHYEPHYDHSLKTDSKFDDNQGNRIATVLFYMSDVPLGGATVFPMLGVRVSPIRGSAAFWLNLHPSGEGDLATFHAACPVLYGSKWVSNKWIHQVGQEFIKPCNLEYQEEGIFTPIPPLVSRSSS